MRSRFPKLMFFAPWLGAIAVLGIGALALVSDRSALWQVVQVCTADARITGAAFPCRDVDFARDIAVLRASVTGHHVIVTPLRRIDGIESPLLQSDATPNYVAAAWAVRREIAASVPRPLAWDDFGLAINSFLGRSQDQLHIHVECLNATVRDILRAHGRELPTDRWSDALPPLRGHPYKAIRIVGDRLDDTNIFAMAAQGLKIAQRDMFNLSLALVGAQFDDGSRGFYLLGDLDYESRPYAAHAEDLLDPRCRA